MPHTTAASVLRSVIAVRRLGTAVNADVRLILEDLFAELAAELARIDPAGPSAERWRRERLAKYADAVRHLTAEAFADVRRTATDDLAIIGAHEAEMVAERLRQTIGAVNLAAVGVDIRPGKIGRAMVRSILSSDPIDGLTLQEWFAGQAEGTARRVLRQVRLGMLQSEGVDDLVRRIRGRSAGILYDGDGKAVRTKAGGFRHRYAGGVMDTTTREAETIVRTATNYVANRAHIETYNANADVVGAVRFTATLDGRTSEACRAYDGEEWPLGSPDIQTPPLHPNCRSVLAPVVAWDRLGIEPPEPSTRASMGGQVSATLDYESWLKTQPEAFQREVLGPGRYRLFAEGRMSLKDMIRTDGSVIPLRELRDE